MTVTAPVTKRCPHVDEVDTGAVTLTFVVPGDAPELHGLAALLASYSEMAVSHEDFTEGLVRDLYKVGCREARSMWTTAGMAVEVVAS